MHHFLSERRTSATTMMLLSSQHIWLLYKYRPGELVHHRPYHESTFYCPLVRYGLEARDDRLHVLWRCKVAFTLWWRLLQWWTQEPQHYQSVCRHKVAFLTSRMTVLPRKFTSQWLWTFSNTPATAERRIGAAMWTVFCVSAHNALAQARRTELHDAILADPHQIALQVVTGKTSNLRAVLHMFKKRQQINVPRFVRSLLVHLSSMDEWMHLPELGPMTVNEAPSTGTSGSDAVIVSAQIACIESAAALLQPTHSANNFAEYSGLLGGLRLLKRDVSSIVLIGDSSMIIQQLDGFSSVRMARRKPRFESAVTLLDKLQFIELNAPRCENTMADCAANIAMDLECWPF